MLQLIDREDALIVAALPEDVDLFTSPDVRAAGEGLLDGGCRFLVLDTSTVAHIDSSGITVLLAFWQRLDEAGGAMVLSVPDPHLRWRLDILGLDSVMDVTQTLPDAVTRARGLRDDSRRPERHPSHTGTESA
ncbi:STAS domain-containing protein [Streptomyces sp. LP11]|uniref:STAS domain-containing protein n=1 Tax=Streptomyces pyxinicus TaxID=2970331 RepID=A0ABT2B758_9ACTN|nr:STAS domain-containing protein [Streptomyces sp. LP11]MCS0604358.1 STAS domain-containing protein [Streptomyces sp. LP11]